jgi:hypothetical protein
MERPQHHPSRNDRSLEEEVELKEAKGKEGSVVWDGPWPATETSRSYLTVGRSVFGDFSRDDVKAECTCRMNVSWRPTADPFCFLRCLLFKKS